MESIDSSPENYLTLAENYYKAMLEKDFDKMASYLQDDVYFLSPLAEMHGKERVVFAAKGLSEILKNILFRGKFSTSNQIMFAYDFIFQEPIGELRSAALIEFTNNLISRIELFFDGRPFNRG